MNMEPTLLFVVIYVGRRQCGGTFSSISCTIGLYMNLVKNRTVNVFNDKTYNHGLLYMSYYV